MGKYVIDGFRDVGREDTFFFTLDSGGRLIKGGYNNPKLASELGILPLESDAGTHIYDYINHWSMPEESRLYVREGYEKILSGYKDSFQTHSDTTIANQKGHPIHIHLSAGRSPMGIINEMHEESAVTAGKREGERLIEGFGGAAHELKSPLNIIGGLMAQTSKEIERLEIEKIGEVEIPEHLRYLEYMERHYQRLNKTVWNMLKLAEKRLDINKREAKLWDDILFPALNHTSHVINYGGIRIDRDDGIEEASLFTDPDLMQIVYVNLISNAAKHTPDYGRIGCGIKEMPGEYWLNVENEGSVIPDEYKHAIFDAGFKIPGTEKNGSNGTGIGLATCRRIAGALDERIFIEEGRKEGANFIITCKRE
jgi:signal transduction histidine kinase